MRRWLSFVIFIHSSLSLASFQSGISMELGLGYPQLSASLPNVDARYDGFAIQGLLILPLLDYHNNFSIDLTGSYRYASYQNTASTGQIAEWAQMQGLGPGLRFNLKNFFLGTEFAFLNGRHLIAGNNSQIIDYKINPIFAHCGLNFAIGDSTSIAVSYSQSLLKGSADVSGSQLTVNEQYFLLSFQIDFGVGFLNVIKKDSLFELRDSGEFRDSL